MSGDRGYRGGGGTRRFDATGERTAPAEEFGGRDGDETWIDRLYEETWRDRFYDEGQYEDLESGWGW